MLNQREIDVLNILWLAREPMTCSDIVAEKRDLTQNTAIAVIRKLLSAGLINIHGTTYCGRVLGRTYVPAPESKQVILQDFVDRYASIKGVIPLSELIEELRDV